MTDALGRLSSAARTVSLKLVMLSVTDAQQAFADQLTDKTASLNSGDLRAQLNAGEIDAAHFIASCNETGQGWARLYADVMQTPSLASSFWQDVVVQTAKDIGNGATQVFNYTQTAIPWVSLALVGVGLVLLARVLR